MTTDRITFFHAPHSRSLGAYLLVAELGADIDLHPIDMDRGAQRQPDYLAVNPMGKVPALLHHGVLVSEQAAVYLYLAEQFPDTGLHVPPGDPQRGAYLRWMVFYNACFEPALMDRVLQRDPGKESASPYGSFDAVIDTLAAQLDAGPWLLGERFTAADVLWGAALDWTTQFKMLPARPVFADYVARFNARPAIVRARAANDALAAELTARADVA